MIKKIIPILLLFYVLSSSAYTSFVINKYLFPSESAASVITQNVLYNGENYTIYILNNSWIFLTSNNKVVSGKDTVDAVIHKYFVDKYMPKQQDLDEIKQLIYEINRSRNNGDKFAGYEEDTCKSILGERYHKPSNWQEVYHNDIYYFYSVATCSKMGKVIGCSNPDQIYDSIAGFFIASENNTMILDKLLSDVNSINENNVNSKFVEMKTLLNKLESNTHTLEESKYRVPIGGVQECPDCFGICPPILYNHTAISKLKDKIEELQVSTEPLSKIGNFSKKLYSEIKRRIAYKEGKDLDKIYRKSVLQSISKFEKVEQDINFSIEKIKDNETSKGFEELINLKKQLNETLENYNYSNISARLSYFNSRLSNVSKRAKENLKKYKEVALIKNKIEAYLYILQQSGYTEVNDLRDEKAKLDVLFEKGISLKDVDQFKEEYSKLLNEVKEIKSNEKLDVVLGNYARKTFAPMANGIISTLSSFNLKNQAILNQLPFFTGIITGLFIFSLAFFASVIFYTLKPVVFGVNLHTHNIKFIYFGFMGFIAFVGLILGALSYFPISTGIVNAPVDQIMSSILSGNNIWIVVDRTDPSFLNERSYCANSIKEELKSNGKEVHLYYLNEDGTCTYGNESISDCLYNKQPEIILKASEFNSITGSDVGFIRIYVKGNGNHFKECILASLIE